MSIRRRYIGGAGALLAASAGGWPSAGAAQQPDDLVVTVRAAPRVVPPGGRVTLTVVARNAWRTPMRLVSPGWGPVLDAEITPPPGGRPGG